MDNEGKYFGSGIAGEESCPSSNPVNPDSDNFNHNHHINHTNRSSDNNSSDDWESSDERQAIANS